MIASILCVYRLILPEFRTRFFYLILASTVVALLDMVGVASIAPLVAVMVDPAALAKSGSMRTLLTALGYGARVPPVHMLGFMTIGFFVIGCGEPTFKSVREANGTLSSSYQTGMRCPHHS